jgi:hypothetical protein
MKTGDMPTDLNERTGEETPPGMSFWASAKSFSDRAYREAGAGAALGLDVLAMGGKCKRKAEIGRG